jgi:V8-like Glu-specific endopeptidase
MLDKLRKNKQIVRNCAVLAVVTILSGCSAFGNYSYSEDSSPRLSPSQLNQQSPSASLAAPLNNVCHLKTKRRNIKRLWLWELSNDSSAALIDGRYLITAAHNVFDYPISRLTQIDVRCNTLTTDQAQIDATLFRQAIKKSVDAPKYEYKVFNKTGAFEYDFGFVDLGKDLGLKQEFLVDRNIQPNIGETVFIGGFPGGNIGNASTLYSGSGVIVDIDTNLLTYDIKTATGNSGGPVWIVRAGKKYIVGVHVSPSRARLFNTSFHDQWEAWLKR